MYRSLGASLLTVVLVGGCAGGPSGSPAMTSTPPSASPVEPSPSLTVTPTQLPTPISAAAWTGLNWSDGVPGPKTDTGWIDMTDIVAWGDGYVGVGVLYTDLVDAGPGQTFRAATMATAFLTSTDGRHWTISQLGALSQGESCPSIYEGVENVVATGRELVAFGFASCEGKAPKLWRSVDGRTWQLVDSPTWRAAWDTTPPNALFAVAGGPEGIVAIGGTERNPLRTQGPLKDGPPVIVNVVAGADGLFAARNSM